MGTATLVGGLALALDASEAQLQFAIRAGRFEDYTPVLRGSVLTTLKRMEALQFDTEGSVFGGAWPPLAPSTIREKARLGYGGFPMLVRTTQLRKSLAGFGKNGWSILQVTPFALTFGTRVPYAEYHQQPDGATGGHLPQRQVIPDPLPDAVIEELRENVRDYLVEGRVRGRS